MFCLIGLGLAGCGDGYDCAKPEVHGTVYRLLKEPTLLPRTLLQSSNIQANPVGRALMGQWYGKTLLAASWSEREPKLRAELVANKAKLAGYSGDKDLSQKIEEAKTRLENQKALCDQDKINACPPGVRRRFHVSSPGYPCVNRWSRIDAPSKTFKTNKPEMNCSCRI